MNGISTYCFIINCASNAYRAENFFKERESELRSQFPGSEFIYIREKDSIKEIAKTKSAYHTHIIACGGDGTVSKAANGLIGSNAILGVIPLGSGNDFAQSIHLNGDFEQAILVLKSNRTMKVDAIETNNGCFLNTFGIGVDGATNYFASELNFASGFIRYFFGGLKALFTSKPFTANLKISGEFIQFPHKVWMIALANGRNEGGRYTISPASDHSDGIFEIVVVHPVSRIRLIFEFIKLSFGIPFKDGVVEIFSSDRSAFIKVNEPQRAHADGEQLALFNAGEFKILPGTITVLSAQDIY